MNWLEIIGSAAVYIACVLALASTSLVVMGYRLRNRGLEAVFVMILPPIAITVVGAIVGLFLLGRMIG